MPAPVSVKFAPVGYPPIRCPFGRLTAIAYGVRFRVRFRSISAAPESTIRGEIDPFGLNRVRYSGREAG